MASVDLNLDYKEAQKKIEASKAYKELKTQYDDTVKSAGESFENKKQDLTKSLNQVKEQQKRFQREIKNQFEQLLDINNVTGGKGSNSIAYVKRLLLKTIKNIEPKLLELLNEEALNAVGCDEQQTFNQQVLYIKVSSIDLINLLKNTVIKLIIFFIIILNYNIKTNILLILAVILSNHYMYINDYNVLVKNIVKYRSCI